MKIDLCPEVTEAIREIQLSGEMHLIISDAEDFILDICDDDEQTCAKVVSHIKALRYVRGYLLKISQSKSTPEKIVYNEQ